MRPVRFPLLLRYSVQILLRLADRQLVITAQLTSATYHLLSYIATVCDMWNLKESRMTIVFQFDITFNLILILFIFKVITIMPVYGKFTQIYSHVMSI